MGIMCPQHGIQLKIEQREVLQVPGIYSPVIIGKCPKCNCFYTNQRMAKHLPHFTYAGILYVYYKQMTKIKDPQSDTVKRVKKTQISTKAMTTRPQTEQKKEDLPQPKSQEEIIQAARKKIQSGDYICYYAHRVIKSSQMRTVCPEDKEPLLYVGKVTVTTRTQSYRTSGMCCLRCSTLYAYETHNTTTDQQSKMSALRTANDEFVFDSAEKTLFVSKGVAACQNKGHTVTAATGILEDKQGAEVKININYCPQCRKCFISYDEYRKYRDRYGYLLGNIKSVSGNTNIGTYNLAEESPLRLCGYTVNQNDDLTPYHRHHILEYMLEHKLMSKPEIIQYLNFFIRQNGSQRKMHEAVRRWEADLQWVREYNMHRQQEFRITGVRKNR